MISSWPVSGQISLSAIEAFDDVKDVIVKVRNLRSEHNVAPSKPLAIHLVVEDLNILSIMKTQESYFKKFLNADHLMIEPTLSTSEETILLVGSHIQTYVIKSGIIDTEKEKEQLLKQKEQLEQEIERSKQLLSNENFMKKAPEVKKLQEEEKYANYLKQYDIVITKLKAHV
jgi:valyl-tRNA synthetase